MLRRIQGAAALLIFPLLVFSQTQKAEVEPGVIFIKLKEREHTQRVAPQNHLDLHTHPAVTGFVPLRKAPANARTAGRSVLDGLYKVSVDNNTDIHRLLASLQSYPNVLYAEPVYKEQLFFTPNDPKIASGEQPYLDRIHIYDAWDITQGDEGIVIGIIDTGLDFGHDDIKNKIYRNEGEIPGNNEDDDGNGFVDDYRGYDFADEDTLPQSDYPHGNRVGGLAGAETNNGTGIAGAGFKSRIGALKIFTSSSNTSRGSYEAIQYAADNGYDIINLSWGSAGTYSQAHQDIINYAVLERNVVVVAAAGNTPEDLKFYPASYDNVLSVAASNSTDDEKASFSTYSHSVDLMAPGNGVLSTNSNNGYSADYGTSYSTPLVAGVAALVKAHYPHLNARQIMELIRVTADDAYAAGNNQSFSGKLGTGRLNAYRALTDENVKSVRASNFHFGNGSGEYAYYGDTVTLSFDLTSFLSPIRDGMISFSSSSEYVSFLTDQVSIGSMDTLEVLSVSEKFFTLSEHTPANTTIYIRLDYQDEGYTDFQYLEMTTSPDFVDFGNSNLKITLAGNGNLGYPGNSSQNGTGMTWNGQQVAAHIGFFAGRSAALLSDNLPVEVGSWQKSLDFSTRKNIRSGPGEQTDHLSTNMFQDTLGLIVAQKSFAAESEDFLILEYRLINNSADTLSGLASGLYFDWDLGESTQNRAFFHAGTGTIISHDMAETVYSGIRTYYDDEPVYQALDIAGANGNTPDLGMITDSARYSLATKLMFDSAGTVGDGNNVAAILSQDSITIAPEKSMKVAFMIALAPDMQGLHGELNEADSVYRQILLHPDLLETFVSCEGAALEIDPVNGDLFRFYTDPGAANLIAENDTLFTGAILTDTSFYLISLDSGFEGDVRRLDISLVSDVADFELNPDTLYLDQPTTNLVTFTDKSFRPVSWSWDFDNGSQASLQNPTMNYSTPGTYHVSLSVTNELGCTGSKTKTLLVVERPPQPRLPDDTLLCAGAILVITAPNTDSLAIYDATESPVPVVTGTDMLAGPFESDSCIYVTNISGPFESLKTRVCIAVENIKSDFTFLPDTSRAEPFVLLTTTSSASDFQWYIDGAVAGSENSISFEISKNAYEVALVATSQAGCTDSTARTVRFSQSPAPAIYLTQPCIGEDLFIAPEGGVHFGFYADAALDSLIRKGRSLLLEQVTDSLQIYVVGLDSLLPSAPLAVSVQPENPDFSILANPDTMILSESNTALFTCSDTLLTGYKWYFNGSTEASKSPTFFFNAPGNYEVVLEAASPAGCVATDTLKYVVLNEQKIIILSTSAEAGRHFFPNPTTGKLWVGSLPEGARIELSDLSGKLVSLLTSGPGGLIDLSEFSKGLYLLTIQVENQKKQQRIVLY